MGWKKDFPNLRTKLISKSTSESALDKQVSRLAHKLSLTSREAVFVIAREQGVGYQTDFSKLTSAEQSNVAKNPGKLPLVHPSKKGRAPSQTLTLQTPLGSINDPLLSKAIIKEAKAMSETAYPYLYVFENSIRNFINQVMQGKFGPNWWDTQLNNSALRSIATNVAQRMNSEERYSFHGKRGAHPIYYSDFSNLIQILRSKTGVFDIYFNNLPGKLQGFITKLEEIQPSRNISSHHNPLSSRDLNRVNGYLIDWLKQLEYLKIQGVV